ncbi:MAG: TerB family tellurite resistance protein [Alphaproteobacteria bacterium]|nr:TerB family tellurite resistance protein [Alphaproteobacteria bacterium]MBL6776690.1 TerB family tellurite resistance protein [Alphaproteobacteria bacterium]
MFKTVAEWLKQDKKVKPEGSDTDELASLVTALMIEAANADGSLAEEEKVLITEVIARQFELGADKAAEMMRAAIDQSSERVELHSLLRRLRDNSDYEERLGVMEMVWMVVLADGKLDHIEAQLMRRLAGLLFVSDVDSGLAAKTAKSNLGLA